MCGLLIEYCEVLLHPQASSRVPATCHGLNGVMLIKVQEALLHSQVLGHACNLQRPCYGASGHSTALWLQLAKGLQSRFPSCRWPRS